MSLLTFGVCVCPSLVGGPVMFYDRTLSARTDVSSIEAFV